MTAEPFEYPRRDWPANIVMVGLCPWDPPSEPPAWLKEIKNPLVLVTTSSEFQDDGRLVQAALDALAQERFQSWLRFRQVSRPGSDLRRTPGLNSSYLTRRCSSEPSVQ